MRKYMKEQMFFESIPLKDIDHNLQLLAQKLNGSELGLVLD